MPDREFSVRDSTQGPFWDIAYTQYTRPKYPEYKSIFRILSSNEVAEKVSELLKSEQTVTDIKINRYFVSRLV